MKLFTKVMVIIASVAIGILVVVVSSLAWFTSNPEVDAREVTMNSASTLVVAFDSNTYESNYRYYGEDGDDETFVCPYGYFKVNLSNSSPEKGNNVKMDFSTVQMKCAILPTQETLIENLFQVQIACYVEDAEGTYTLSKTESDDNYNVFVSGGAGGYRLIANDYTLDSGGYLYQNSARVVLPQGVYYFAFTFTFLPEDGGGYIPDAEGTYIGQVSYAPIKGSGSHYDYVGGTYVTNSSGEYSKVVTDYVTSVTRYNKVGDVYSENANGSYIKVKDHLGNDLNEYVEFQKFSYVEGFPYRHVKYQGAKYEFSIVCSVEEVSL